MFMVMLVLDNPQQLDAVLQAWHEIGIPGATIIQSTGAHRQKITRIGGRYFMGLGQPTTVEEGHYTLFVVVESEEMVNTCLDATETVTGNLDEPNTGVLMAWPLIKVKGFPPTTKD